MRSAAFQAFLVVLGVVLAFTANEWREARAVRAEARHALASIFDEIEANRAAVLAATAYHGEKLDMIYAADAPLTPAAFPRGFVAPAQVSRVAWSLAGEIGALAELPFEQVLALGEVYALQDAYAAQQATVGRLIYDEMFEKGPQGLVDNGQGLSTLLATFRYRESQLVAAYDTALAARGATSP